MESTSGRQTATGALQWLVNFWKGETYKMQKLILLINELEREGRLDSEVEEFLWELIIAYRNKK